MINIKLSESYYQIIKLKDYEDKPYKVFGDKTYKYIIKDGYLIIINTYKYSICSHICKIIYDDYYKNDDKILYDFPEIVSEFEKIKNMITIDIICNKFILNIAHEFRKIFNNNNIDTNIYHIDSLDKYQITDNYVFILSPQHYFNNVKKILEINNKCKCIYYNMEQMKSRISFKNKEKYNKQYIELTNKLISNSLVSFDYNKDNLKYFNNTIYLPPPIITNINQCEKIYDILFIGLFLENTRRYYIINNLKRFFKIKIVYDNIGDKLTEIINQSKVVLNLHYFDENTLLEEVRLNEIINSDTHILSELPHIDVNDMKEKYKDRVTFINIIEKPNKIIKKTDPIVVELKKLLKKPNKKYEHNLNNDLTDKILIENIKSSIEKYEKVGVVITTNGYWGVNIKQCIECYLKNLTNYFIVLYVNESHDSITLSLKEYFPEIMIIYINDQNKNGGLTATWNDGIDLCIKNKCNTIILSNDDILFDNSIKNIIKEATNERGLKYFGPITNNPGPSEINKLQYGTKPMNKKPYTLIYNNNYININGFFMVFPKHVLIKNKFNKDKYFDPSYPFGGNETEWFNRFIKIGGEPILVPSTFIYHYKFARWRENTKFNNVCLYTINTGGYEGDKIYIEPKLPIDYLYFTDQFNLVYKCIELGIIPFYITSKDSKLLQRTIKTSPHLYLPYIYDTSIYIDGNMQPKFNNNILNNFIDSKFNIICFSHPERNTIKEESCIVIEYMLESKENVNKILELQKKDGFKDNIGLTETNVLIRKHKNIIEFSNEWKKNIEICRRDQISFDYLLHKYNLNYIRLSHQHKLDITSKKLHINPYCRKILIK